MALWPWYINSSILGSNPAQALFVSIICIDGYVIVINNFEPSCIGLYPQQKLNCPHTHATWQQRTLQLKSTWEEEPN